MKEHEELVKRLDQMAITASHTSKMLAAAKTERNRSAGDEHALYFGAEPRDTTEYMAARAIESLTAEIKRLRDPASSDFVEVIARAITPAIRAEARREALEEALALVNCGECDAADRIRALAPKEENNG